MTLPTLNGSNYISVQSFTLKAFFPQLTRAFAITGCYSNVAHTHRHARKEKQYWENIWLVFHSQHELWGCAARQWRYRLREQWEGFNLKCIFPARLLLWCDVNVFSQFENKKYGKQAKPERRDPGGAAMSDPSESFSLCCRVFIQNQTYTMSVNEKSIRTFASRHCI